MNYFEGAKDIKEAKETYRRLAKQLHPDMGGSKEAFEDMQRQFESFCNHISGKIFDDYRQSGGKRSYDSDDISYLAKILKEIVEYDIDIEIIGTWIYCYRSYAYKDQLKAKGFWFSSKHKAWVFSGEQKRAIRSKNTLADIRSKYGSKFVKHEEKAKITA